LGGTGGEGKVLGWRGARGAGRGNVPCAVVVSVAMILVGYSEAMIDCLLAGWQNVGYGEWWQEMRVCSKTWTWT